MCLCLGGGGGKLVTNISVLLLQLTISLDEPADALHGEEGGGGGRVDEPAYALHGEEGGG